MRQKMIIMAPPYGMAAIIKLTCVGLWLAKALGKTPVIWWGTACLYSNNQRKNFYSVFFKPRGQIEAEVYDAPLHAPAGMVYPQYWQTIDNLSLKAIDDNVPPNHDYTMLDWKCSDAPLIKQAEVCILHSYLTARDAWVVAGKNILEYDEESFSEILAAIFNDFFAPNECVSKPAESLYEKFAAGSTRKIGIHYRGSDKVIEATVPSVKRHVIIALKCGEGVVPLNVFVATDCEKGLAEIRQRLGDRHRIFFQNYDRVSSVAMPLHYRKDTAFQNAIDVGVDVELLSRCDKVCGNWSSGIAWWVNNRRKSLGIDGKMVHVGAGLEDSIISIKKLAKAVGLRRAMILASERVRAWVIDRLIKSGISRRRFRKMFGRSA